MRHRSATSLLDRLHGLQEEHQGACVHDAADPDEPDHTQEHHIAAAHLSSHAHDLRQGGDREHDVHLATRVHDLHLVVARCLHVAGAHLAAHVHTLHQIVAYSLSKHVARLAVHAHDLRRIVVYLAIHAHNLHLVAARSVLLVLLQ